VSHPSQDEPLAILAGGGALPLEVAEAARAAGRRVVVVGIRGEADASLLAPLSPHWVEWGQVGRLLDLLAGEHCRDLLLVGGVVRRPDFRSVAADFGTVRRLPKIVAALAGGDDGLLRRVIGLLEGEGLRVLAVPDVAPALVLGEGPLGRRAPDAAHRRDIERGLALLAVLGPFDVGQATIVAGGRVVAIEAAEGTDALIDRYGAVRAAGRIARDSRGILVKAAKPGQDRRVDLPVIGPQTVERAAAAGLAGIAAESGCVLVVRRAETATAADAAGLFVSGVTPTGASDGRR
jgi:DUF1009 family protein